MTTQPTPTPPKAILFDIGGVVVVSPFQAILDYERINKIPVGYINYAIQAGPHDTGAWQQLERGDAPLDDAWFAAFNAQLTRQEIWSAYLLKHQQSKVAEGVDNGTATIPVPAIDAKTLFWHMMKISRTPDPHMYPALRTLEVSGRFVLGAFSNNVSFPADITDEHGLPFSKELIHAPHPNPHAADSTDITTHFDVFLGSAEVGVRKPDPRAYRLAVRELDRVARRKGLGGVKAADTLFLDDIGINLKFARREGLRTIKVELGGTKEAVKALERETGMRLSGEKVRL